MHNQFIDALKWRYATKKFDPAKKVSPQDVDTLLEAARLSASSYGLQPWKIFVITNPDIRTKLSTAAYMQSQVTDASHLLVIAGQNQVPTSYIENFTKLSEITRGLPEGSLNAYKDMMVGTVGSKLPADIKEWTSKQTYIVLGTLLSAAALMKIDATPMEGFNGAQVDEILGLTTLGLHSTLLFPIGYRAEDDKTASYKKVRLPKEDLFTHIK